MVTSAAPLRLSPWRKLFRVAGVTCGCEEMAMTPAEPAALRWELRAQVRELAAAVQQIEMTGDAFGGDRAIIRRYAAGDDVPLQDLLATIERIQLVISAV